MIWVYFGLYTLFLAIVWGFFIVTKIHAFKFKNFSNNIEKVTFILFVVLIVLSVLGYIVIFFGESSSSSIKLDFGGDNKDSYNTIEY